MEPFSRSPWGNVHRFLTTIVTCALILPGLLIPGNAQPFIEQPIETPEPDTLYVAWADYDRDGDLDLVLGTAGRVYRNEGVAGFVLAFELPEDVWGIPRWADYDRDGFPDLLIASHERSYLLRNEGGVSLVDSGIVLKGMRQGDVAWADYDNDGDPDLLLGGQDWGTVDYLTLYRNDDGQLQDSEIPLPVWITPSFAWGDLDGDGDLDLVLTGGDPKVGSGSAVALFMNEGGTGFRKAPLFIPGVWAGSLTLNDYDLDGDLDILLVGQRFDGLVARTYRNEGEMQFGDTSFFFGGVDRPSVSWGDYDADGYPDLLVAGIPKPGENPVSRLFRNTAGTEFEMMSFMLPDIWGGLEWGDFDADGDLDLVFAGSGVDNGAVARVLRNDTIIANAPPTIPGGLNVELMEDRLVFSWAGSSDAEQSGGLTYNVRIGNTPGAGDVMTAMSLADGSRLLPIAGNAGLGTAWVLRVKSPATYHWTVQAVDSAYMASPFAVEQSFVLEERLPTAETGPSVLTTTDEGEVTGEANPGGAATVVYFEYGLTTDYSNQTAEQELEAGYATIQVAGRLVDLEPGAVYHYRLVASNRVGVAHGEDRTLQTEIFSFLAPADSLEYVRHFTWGDYDLDHDLDVAFPLEEGLLINEAGVLSSGVPTFTGVGLGPVAFGDPDNDGNMDVVFAGSGHLFEYRKGPGFEGAPRVYAEGAVLGTVHWADYDGDGDMDLLVHAVWSGLGRTVIHRNTGSGTFVEGFTDESDAEWGTASWADYDEDGDLDLLRVADGETVIVLNDTGRFDGAYILLQPLFSGSGVWTDFDGDGDYDVALCGRLEGEETYRLFFHRNDGSDVFTLVSTDLEASEMSNLSPGDYDNDGDPDLLVGSWRGWPKGVMLFRNDGGFQFTSEVLPEIPYGPAGWADLDNDGDLDFLVGGYAFYLNNIGLPNSVPSLPDGLSVSWAGEWVELRWNPATDANQTWPLTYNVQMGRSPGGSEVISPMSAMDGYRRIVEPGNAGYQLHKRVRDLPGGTYFWSVQAVDNAHAGSPFAPEASFTVPSIPTITAIPDQVVEAGTSTEAIGFEIGDLETVVSDLTITVSSSNMETIPPGGIVVGGTGSERTAVVTVPPEARSDALVTISVENPHGRAAVARFKVDVLNAPPVLSGLPDRATLVGDVAGPIPFAVSDGWTLVENLQLTVTSSDPAVIPASNIAIEGTGGERSLVITRNGSASGTVEITVTVEDEHGGTTSGSFRLFVQTFSVLTDAGLPGISNGAAAWGDYDGDGDYDLVVMGEVGTGRRTLLFMNAGDFNFIEMGSGLPGLSHGSVTWEDFDRDGVLDILMSGTMDGSSATAVTRVYLGGGEGNFEEFPVNLPGVYNGSSAWADFDGDGDLDAALAGIGTDGVSFGGVYENRGAGNFIWRESENLPAGVGYTVALWCDWDLNGRPNGLFCTSISTRAVCFGKPGSPTCGDEIPGLVEGTASLGFLTRDNQPDLVMIGDLNWGGKGIEVFKNVSHLRMEHDIPDVVDGAIAWGDYDQDGDSDVLLSGLAAGVGRTYLVRNDGGIPVAVSEGIPEGGFKVAAWADVDGDGDLDCLLAEAVGTGANETLILQNRTMVANTAPQPPSGLRQVGPVGNTVLLEWEAGSHPKQAYGLTYGLRVGTAPGLSDVISPLVNPATGSRLVPRPGSSWSATTAFLSGLTNGIYYWSVQTIDNRFVGSAFAEEQSFTVTNAVPVTVDQSFELAEDGELEIVLEAFDGDGDPLVFTIVDPPVHGMLEGEPPVVIYRPRPDYHGPDGFTYAVDDGFVGGEPVLGTVELAVTSVRDPYEVDFEFEALSPEEVRLRMTGVSGQEYAVESTEDLKVWREQSRAIADNDGVIVFSDVLPAAGHRFYRLRLVP